LSAYRVRLETAAGAFATLGALAPWEALQAAGWSEDHAAYVAGGLLTVAALVALAVRHAQFAQKSFHIAMYNETFRLSAFLRDFAFFALTLVTLAAALLVYILITEGQ